MDLNMSHDNIKMLFLILDTPKINPYYDKHDEIVTPDIDYSLVTRVETHYDMYKGVVSLTVMKDIFYICGTILSTIGIYYFIIGIHNSMFRFQGAGKIDCL
jgi:hypothetical protein